MSSLYYSARSTRKIVHYPGCPYIRNLEADYLKSFRNAEEPLSGGYRFCKCCSKINAKLQVEMRIAEKLCWETGIRAYATRNEVLVDSRFDSWRIVIGDHYDLLLYHKNIKYTVHDSISQIPGYHLQDFHSGSVKGYIRYIAGHDAATARRMKNQKKSKNQDADTLRYGIGITDISETYQGKRHKGMKRRKKLSPKKRRKLAVEIRRVSRLLDDLRKEESFKPNYPYAV